MTEHKDIAISRWARLKEVLITSLVGDLPTILLGVLLRKLLYRTILAQIGKSVYIQDGVELLKASCIFIGDRVHIFRGVRIDGRGQNNRLYLRDGVALERGVDIGAMDNSHLDIGEGTFIGPYTSIAGPGNIKIGKNCLIAAHSGIFANNHNVHNLTEDIKDQGITREGIVIEDNCWLGHRVTVLDGITIGRGSVIGAGAVVTKSIPPNSIAVGVPARVIGQRGAAKNSVEKNAKILV